MSSIKILKRSGPRIESCGPSVAILRQLLKSISLLYLCKLFVEYLWTKLRRSFIYYVRKIFQKTNISYPLISTRTCVYQGVRNVSFSKNFANVFNEWSLINHCQNYTHLILPTSKCDLRYQTLLKNPQKDNLLSLHFSTIKTEPLVLLYEFWLILTFVLFAKNINSSLSLVNTCFYCCRSLSM